MKILLILLRDVLIEGGAELVGMEPIRFFVLIVGVLLIGGIGWWGMAHMGNRRRPTPLAGKMVSADTPPPPRGTIPEFG